LEEFAGLRSQATGLGLTRNITHCYAAIIRMWQPGDCIFLFGFSRGAYTVRCVAGVLALCGVPTRMKDGTALHRDDRTTKKIATEAVKDVYQHVSSPRDTKYYEQRTALAQRFRTQYGSGADGKSNAYPHFIGVFDTVAAVANTGSLIVVAVLAVISMLLISEALWFASSWLFASSFSYWFWFACVAVVSAVIGGIAYLATHIKVAFGLDGYTAWQTLHLTEARMKFYDLQLNPNVGWARHALAIDEHRADFDRVPWGWTKIFRETAPDEPDWLQQIWFAGNHSDVGGSYIENESRLSDASLQWMIEAAQQIPNDLKLDGSVLQLYPAADGMQHDECRGLVFRYAQKIDRKIPTDAPLHSSVYERFKLLGVVHYDEMRPYRPEGLRHHEGLKQYY
jgi:T6SS, Phospholipase effector Tle1-like, catalytic domain